MKREVFRRIRGGEDDLGKEARYVHKSEKWESILGMSVLKKQERIFR